VCRDVQARQDQEMAVAKQGEGHVTNRNAAKFERILGRRCSG